MGVDLSIPRVSVAGCRTLAHRDVVLQSLEDLPYIRAVEIFEAWANINITRLS